jgi:hypothetical protein
MLTFPADYRNDARQHCSASVVVLRAIVVVVMVVMMVMVDFGLFGSREIGPGREPFIDRHGGRHRPSNDCGTEQGRA